MPMAYAGSSFQGFGKHSGPVTDGARKDRIAAQWSAGNKNLFLVQSLHRRCGQSSKGAIGLHAARALARRGRPIARTKVRLWRVMTMRRRAGRPRLMSTMHPKTSRLVLRVGRSPTPISSQKLPTDWFWSISMRRMNGLCWRDYVQREQVMQWRVRKRYLYPMLSNWTKLIATGLRKRPKVLRSLAW